MFPWPDIADAVLAGLLDADRDLLEEGSPQGIDAWPTERMLPYLAASLEREGVGVILGASLPETRRACDLLICERPGLKLYDPRREQAPRDPAAGTLFASLARDETGDLPPTEDLEPGELAENEITSDEAAWTSVLHVAQTTYRDGIPVANTRYAKNLTDRPARALKPYLKHPGVQEAAVFLILCGRDRDTVEHDLGQAGHAMLDHGLGLESAIVRSAPISDRVGNAHAGVLVAAVRAGTD